jgi:hypothetical protein
MQNHTQNSSIYIFFATQFLDTKFPVTMCTPHTQINMAIEVK